MTSVNPTTMDLSTFAGTWTLDPAATTATFHTKAMWVLKVKGTMKAVSGGGTVGSDGTVTGTLVFDTATVDTKNAKRDTHLRTADFLDVEKYPTMTFTATTARPVGAGTFEVTGDLAIHGQSRPITFRADVSVAGDSATVASEVDIDRSAWGLSWAKMGAGLANHVVISARFTRS